MQYLVLVAPNLDRNFCSRPTMSGVLQSSILKQNSKFETAIWAAKLVLLTVGSLTTFILFKVAIVPYTFNLILSTLPSFWISLRGWLSPPYIYVILNFIIIIIAASSTFQHQNNHTNKNSKSATKLTHQQQHHSPPKSPKKHHSHDDATCWQDVNNNIQEDEKQQLDVSAFSFEKATTNPSMSSPSPYSCFRKFDKTQKEKAIDEKVKTEEEQNTDNEEDSLEETWKSIMEGKEKTATRHLKKSETWDSPPRLLHKANEVVALACDGVGGDEQVVLADDGGGDEPVGWALRELRKSDTFNDTVSLSREKSMSQDEVNQRAEEFIKKFNYEMRLQRLESEQRLMEMANRIVHC